MFRNNRLLLFLLVCMVIALLGALTPFSDIDRDGTLDSLLTDGFILLPAFCAASGVYFFLSRTPSAWFGPLQSIYPCLLPPPIF
jgi:hypothetical protein